MYLVFPLLKSCKGLEEDIPEAQAPGVRLPKGRSDADLLREPENKGPLNLRPHTLVEKAVAGSRPRSNKAEDDISVDRSRCI